MLQLKFETQTEIQYSLHGQIRKSKAKKNMRTFVKASTDASRTSHSDLKSWCQT